MFRGDTKRIIQVSFTQNGVPYILSECNVAFTATKPDGTFLNCTCDVDENKNIAIYDLDKDNGDSDNHKQTTAVEGKVECQFVISSVEVVDGETVDHKIASAEFNILVMKTIYNEEDILNSDVALGALAQYYVPVSRNIAGVDLTDNITAEELRGALQVYGIGLLPKAPTPSTIGDYRQLLGVSDGSQITALYLCLGKQSNGTYKWIPIVTGSDIDLSNYVPTIRTIAGISLADDVTAEKLKTALDVKGKIVIHSTLPPTNDLETLAEVGDFWLISKDKALYVCYGKQVTENGYANYFWLCLTDYLKDNTTLAELKLKNNITADELKGALEVSTIGTLFNPPTSNNVGEYRQLVCVGDNTKFTGLYLCLGKQTDGTYKWVEIAPSGNGDVDLSGYVPITRKIADKELSEDITAEELSNALGFEVLEFSTEDEIYEYDDFKVNFPYMIVLSEGYNGDFVFFAKYEEYLDVAHTEHKHLTLYAVYSKQELFYDLVDKTSSQKYKYDSYLAPYSYNAVQNNVLYRKFDAIQTSLNAKVDTSNIVTYVDAGGYDEQVPSAKLFYNEIHRARPVYDDEITELTFGKASEVIAHFPHGKFDSLYVCTKIQHNSPETGVPSTYEWKKLSTEYTLTDTDKQEIADLVVDMIPDGSEVEY